MRKTRKWSEIKNEAMNRERQMRARLAADAELATLPLADLRKAREFTQVQLAEQLDLPQGNVSKLERRVDMYVSTLRRYVEAMGGELEIVARFPNADVRIDLFGDLGKLTENGSKLRAKRRLAIGS